MGIDPPHVCVNQALGDKGSLFVCGMKTFQDFNRNPLKRSPVRFS